MELRCEMIKGNKGRKRVCELGQVCHSSNTSIVLYGNA